MTASSYRPVPQKTSLENDTGRDQFQDTPEMIEHLADELRSQGDPCLPREFYIEDVKRRLAGRSGVPGTQAAPKYMPLQSASVFYAWALRE